MPIKIWLGGLCCKPSAWRKMASTMMKRVKLVIIMSMAGRKPSRVIMIRICSLMLST